jgi:hypothetical protein
VAAKGGDLFADPPDRLIELGLLANRTVASGMPVAPVLRVGFEPTRKTGFSFALLGSFANDPSASFGERELGARAGFRWVLPLVGHTGTVATLSGFAGAELGGSVIWQDAPGMGRAYTFAAQLSPRVGLRYQASERLSITAHGELSSSVLKLDDRITSVFRPMGGLAVGFRL